MALLTSDMPLSAALEQHPTLIPLVSRFGIRLGLGDKSVAAVCAEHAIDAGFMLALMNTYLFEEYFPERKLRTFHLSQIIDYLTKTNRYYERYQLPNIERHLRSFLSMSGGNPSLALIGRFFESFKETFLRRIGKDDGEWFPYCLELSRRLATNPDVDAEKGFSLPSPENAEDQIEALLADMKSIMIKHLSGEYNDNLCYAVIFAISSLEKDVKQHNRIRYRILLPMVAAMESLCRP